MSWSTWPVTNCSATQYKSARRQRGRLNPRVPGRHSSQDFVPAIQLANPRAVFTVIAESSHRMKPYRFATCCRPVSTAMIGPVGCSFIESKGADVASSFMLAVIASIRSAARRCWWKHHSFVCNFDLFAGWRLRVALLAIVLLMCGKLFAHLNQEPAGLRSGV